MRWHRLYSQFPASASMPSYRACFHPVGYTLLMSSLFSSGSVSGPTRAIAPVHLPRSSSCQYSCPSNSMSSSVKNGTSSLTSYHACPSNSGTPSRSKPASFSSPSFFPVSSCTTFSATLSIFAPMRPAKNAASIIRILITFFISFSSLSVPFSIFSKVISLLCTDQKRIKNSMDTHMRHTWFLFFSSLCIVLL